jgi:beta-lactamase class A
LVGADKTGSGDYGISNDIGLMWPPGKRPLVLAVYFTQGQKNATPRDDVIAAATKITIDALR